MQDLFTQVNISDILQECDINNKFKEFYVYIFIVNFYVRRMGR